MRKQSNEMDKDVETKRLCQLDESSGKQSYFDVKQEEQVESVWSQNLKKNADSIHLQEIFNLDFEEELPYDQLYLKIKSHFKPQLEQFLKQNRDNVKLFKLPKQQWNSQTNCVSRYDDKIHYIGQQSVHQYSTFLKIDRNIKRQETQDLNFKYNFSSEMREKYKLDILKTPKTVWRSQEGINEMISLNSRWALNNLDIFQLCSLYYYIVGKTNIDQFTSEQLGSFLEYRLKEKNLNLTVNMESLVSIFQSLKAKRFGRMKSNIFQVTLTQLQQISIQQIQDLSFKSFQTHQFINRKTAYICNSCSQFDVNCICQFENRLGSVRKFLDFCVAQKTLSKNQTLWHQQVIKEANRSVCGDQCYKDPKHSNQATKKLQQFPVIEENQPIIFDRDPCLLAKIYNSDCLSIFIQARFKFKEIREQYLKDLKQLQKQCDDTVFQNHPYDNSTLYIPCSHKEDFNCQKCQCTLFCTKYCDCPQDGQSKSSKCEKKHRGCHCRDRCSADGRCQCRRDQMECDPLLCKCCSHEGSNICSNTQILIKNFQPTLLGRSTVCPGLGLFARRFILKNELIILYCGEILVDDEDEIRDHFDDTFSFYNYSFSSDDKYSIEGRFCGNESRFINHNNNNYINSKTRQIFSQGMISHQVGKYNLAIYAIKNIEPGDEIILNYNEGEKINAINYPWIDLNQKYWNYKQSTIIGNN